MNYKFTRVQNMMYREELALMYGDDVIIQGGDSYNDKIYEKIEGFIEGIEHLGHTVEIIDIEIDKETNPSLFDKLDFYDGE